ncbi:alpha/beta hydrolase family protein [Pseudoduganella sp. OTU4001]|uniref:alpha/beta hydrolase family protein n=1 Tax=Pseudoduganella sp. OTU4001 TaxID=3043854 RepID=UPI00313C76FC
MIKQFLVSLAAVGGLAHAAPPVKDFFAPAEFKDAQLSPSGRYLALRIGKSGLRDAMAVLDTGTRAVVGGVRMSDYDVGDIRWVNDMRLVFNVVDHHLAPGDHDFAPGLYGINRDGSEQRQLVNHTYFGASTTGTRIARHTEPWNTYLLRGPITGAQDSDSIYVQRPVWREESYIIERTELVELNTRNAKASFVNRPAQPDAWMLDHKGQPRLMVSEQAGVETIHLRNAESGEWRALAKFPAYGHAKDGISPVGFMDDKRLLVKARLNGDMAALHVLDLVSGEVSAEPLVSLADFDFSGSPIYSNKKMVGLHFVGDARGTVWFDAGMKATQADVDKQLPDLINIITPAMAPEVPWLLVASYSDRQPRFYSLYNSKTGELKVVGNSHPAINPKDMGRQDFVKIKARDGMQVPAWLTLPAQGGKNLPLVVLVHGGPYLRGTEWGWDADSQFLASRGYAVLEPEFRGSTGYGLKLFKAGIKQWGLAMQDDIADAVKWAVAQGYADPGRVCIMGGSYGGYATLMGLVKDPDLYRCGVAYAAVTDIPMWLGSSMSTISDVDDDYRKYGAPVLLGDLREDAERFTATSPLKQAARIKRPLLLAHGSADRRVPREHYSSLRSALEANKADAEYIEYIGEGHGWSTTANRIDFWTRVEKFLGKHIGAGAKKE